MIRTNLLHSFTRHTLKLLRFILLVSKQFFASILFKLRSQLLRYPSLLLNHNILKSINTVLGILKDKDPKSQVSLPVDTTCFYRWYIIRRGGEVVCFSRTVDFGYNPIHFRCTASRPVPATPGNRLIYKSAHWLS